VFTLIKELALPALLVFLFLQAKKHKKIGY